MITNIFVSKLLFAAQIVIAEILCTVYLQKKSGYGWRLVLFVLGSLVVAAVFPAFDFESKAANFAYSCFLFFALFAVTVFLLKFIYHESWTNVFFCAVAAYTAQHLSYQLSNILTTLLSGGSAQIFGMYDYTAVDFSAFGTEQILYGLLNLLCYFVVYNVVFIVFGSKIKRSEKLKIRSLYALFLATAGLIADIVLNSGFIYLGSSQSLVNNVILYCSNSLGCILLLVVQYGLIQTGNLENELAFVKKMWDQEKRQYETFKENIDIINTKCHDMRYQIRRIGQNSNISGETISEIENAINLYDTMINTGNDVLDTILTEKNLRCLKNRINFTCIADGVNIGFMKDIDIYALFGNVMDNAIEAVVKIPDEEKRIIGFTLHRKGEFVSIEVNNTFEGSIDFENGLPRTTNANRDYHGYGVKSIRMITEKYGGNLTIKAEDGIYNLFLLIPIGEEN